ncbi:MAG: helix-turn-helix transcriptional regulator [Salinivirgaceae bacterium]|nr:helix-turn-helix transcriptional regulator [Salinivirgaceae bacterium]
MEIVERIKKIYDSEGLTPSAFADTIGVHRSNVSQIMSGRQKPSFELLQKILTAFPHYNADWLVMGRGDIYRQPVQTSIFDIIGDDGEPVVGPGFGEENAVSNGDADTNSDQSHVGNSLTQQTQMTEIGSNATNSPDVAAISEQSAPSAELTSVLAHAAQHQAEVKQVVVLYSDNTFVAYNKQ